MLRKFGDTFVDTHLIASVEPHGDGAVVAFSDSKLREVNLDKAAFAEFKKWFEEKSAEYSGGPSRMEEPG